MTYGGENQLIFSHYSFKTIMSWVNYKCIRSFIYLNKYLLSACYVRGTVVNAGHTLVNVTKISALMDSIILSNGTLSPFKTMWKGNKIVNLRPYLPFSHERKLDTLIYIYSGSSRIWEFMAAGIFNLFKDCCPLSILLLSPVLSDLYTTFMKPR